ncbi:MAG: GTPase [bacterium]
MASPTRSLMILAVSVLALLGLLVLLLLTDTLLNIQQNLQHAPDWVMYLVLSGFGLFILVAGWALIRLSRPPVQPRSRVSAPPSEAEIEQRLQSASEQQLDVTAALTEMKQLRERQEAGEIHIAVFGEISSGKSSLIQALIPTATLDTAVTGGTTRTLDHYTWTSAAGDKLILTDMPGTNEANGSLDSLAREEALRAHLVIYVTDGDLTATQRQELHSLTALQKPLILTLNKADRLDQQSQAAIVEKIRTSMPAGQISDIVISQAEYHQPVVAIDQAGNETMTDRQVPAQVNELQDAIQKVIDSDQAILHQLRDSAVFSLVSAHLDAAEQQHRREQAETITSSYAKRAVVGAVAAMTPGTDLLIQGYLGTQLVKELSALYGVPARQIDIDLLLELVQKYASKHYTLLLAVAGNAMKAFPGMGTLAGGLLHAVAYGYLFDALGKGVAGSLEARGELHPLQAADMIEEQLHDTLGSSAKHYARLAFEHFTARKRD